MSSLPITSGPAKATTGVNLRTTASSRSRSLAVVKKGSTVYQTGKRSGTWSQVTVGNKTGWIVRSYLKPSPPAVKTNGAKTGVIFHTRTVIRVGPHSSYALSSSLAQGTTGTRTGRVSGSWHEVKIGRKTGWAATSTFAALTAIKTTGSNVNAILRKERILRAGPHEAYGSMGKFPKGRPGPLSGRTTGTWLEITLDRKKGWIPATDLTLLPAIKTNGPKDSVSLTRDTSLHLGAATTYSVVSTLKSGATATRTGRVSGTWSEIKVGTRTGWTLTTYLKTVTPISSNGPKEVVTANSALNLYASTTTASTVVHRVSGGSSGFLTGRVLGTWSEVRFADHLGWTLTAYLSAIPVITESSEAGTYIVEREAHLRLYADSSAASLGAFAVGTEVESSGQSQGGWLKVSRDAKTGWIPKESVKIKPDNRILTMRSPLTPQLTGVSTSMDELVVRRFSPATSPAMYEEAKSVGWKQWLSSQMNSAEADDQEFLDYLTSKLPLSTKIYSDAGAYCAANGIEWSGVPIVAGARQRAAVQIVRQIFTSRPLNESLTEFWLDHFSIPYIDKNGGASYTIDIEMRKVALSSFPTILSTMYNNLIVYDYLDNKQNVKNAVNENLGRETMELFTLGVGNYTETDVEQASILFSGWHNSWDGKGNVSLHAGAHHYTPTPLTIVGKKYPNSTHAEALESHRVFLNDMAHHPATISHISSKLATRYVSNNPPQSLLDKMASTYRSTGGDIKEIIWTMVQSPEFASSVGHRWKRPGEFLQSLHRSMKVTWDPYTGNVWDPTFHETLPSYMWFLGIAGHQPRSWVAPDGFPDEDSYWMGSSAVLQCVKAAISRRTLDKELTKPGTWVDILNVAENVSSRENALHIIRSLTGYTPNDSILFSVEAPLRGMGRWEQRVDAAVRNALTSPLAFLR